MITNQKKIEKLRKQISINELIIENAKDRIQIYKEEIKKLMLKETENIKKDDFFIETCHECKKIKPVNTPCTNCKK